MSSTSKSPDRIAGFIECMQASLRDDEDRGIKPPIERRKLRTVLEECGQRSSLRFLERLHDRFSQEGIYTEPPLVDSGLRLDDWLLFSSGPFPPDALVFATEKDLQRFVEACLGSGVFRNLELYRVRGDHSGREYPLSNGQRIDLLCQERTKSGFGALVVIELKREHERGTIDQVIGYLDALKNRFPTRAVRSMIVSGREDQVAAALLKEVTGYDIQWYCYQVNFERLRVT